MSGGVVMKLVLRKRHLSRKQVKHGDVWINSK